MYRLLAAEHGGVRERRDQLAHPPYAEPELLAERPNEVWSWDITKLKGPAKWTYFYLYVILDVFSRYAVGWMVQHRESGRAGQGADRPGLRAAAHHPRQLTVHADRGSSMTIASRSRSCSPTSACTKTHTRPTPRPTTRTPKRSSRR